MPQRDGFHGPTYSDRYCDTFSSLLASDLQSTSGWAGPRWLNTAQTGESLPRHTTPSTARQSRIGVPLQNVGGGARALWCTAHSLGHYVLSVISDPRLLNIRTCTGCIWLACLCAMIPTCLYICVSYIYVFIKT